MCVLESVCHVCGVVMLYIQQFFSDTAVVRSVESTAVLIVKHEIEGLN